MSCWDVKDYLAELTDITAYGEEEILPLCRSCLKEIEARLKPDTDKSDIRITAAAAGLAFYKLTIKLNSKSDDGFVTSFKAGDVSINQESIAKKELLERAESFYKNKLNEIIPLCADNSFAFRQVRVM